MAQRLGRDGAQVRAVASDQRAVVYHGDLASRLDGVHRRALPGWTRTQYHHIVVIDRHIHS